MLPLPEEYELLSLFESEPELLDGEDKPWEYNGLRFKTVRGEDEVIVTIYPPAGELTITWARCRAPVLRMKLIELDSITVETQHNNEFLVACGRLDTHSILVKLRLKPSVSVELEQKRPD